MGQLKPPGKTMTSSLAGDCADVVDAINIDAKATSRRRKGFIVGSSRAMPGAARRRLAAAAPLVRRPSVRWASGSIRSRHRDRWTFLQLSLDQLRQIAQQTELAFVEVACPVVDD